MEFIENDFKTDIKTLNDLSEKLKKEGLSFHPIMAINAIQKEVETRLADTLRDHFKGMRIETLGECNAAITAYVNEEEKRWQEFQAFKKAEADKALVQDVKENLEEELKKIPENVKPIKSKKK